MDMKYVLIGMALVLSISAGFVLMSDSDESDAAVVASGTCGTDLNWEYDDATKTLTISGSGTTMNDFSTSPWSAYSNQIQYVVWDTPNLTNIGAHTFEQCWYISSFPIPETVTKIGRYSCISMGGLPSGSPALEIKFPAGLTTIEQYAFNGAKISIQSLPTSLTTIERGAFDGVSTLTSLVVPAGFNATIGDYAFNNCTNLATIVNLSDLNIVAGADTYGGIAKYATSVVGPTASGTCGTNLNWAYVSGNTTLYIYGSGTTQISGSPWVTAGVDKTAITTVLYDTPNLTTINSSYPGVYYQHTNLVKVDLPQSLLKMGRAVFNGCTNLTDIVLPEGMTELGQQTFLECTSLVLGHIPDTIVTLGNDTFLNCTNLELDGLPSGLTRIPTTCFSGCTSLELDELPSGITYIGISAFAQSGVRFTSIPEGVTQMETYAFWDCPNITEITIPSTVVSWGQTVFRNCTNLTTVYYNPVNCTAQAPNWSAFVGCTSLTEITIGETVSVIPNYMFVNIPSLTTINFNAVDCHDFTTDNQIFYGTAVDTIIFGDGVARVPAHLCKDMTATLESVSFNDDLNEVGIGAFQNCSNMVVLALPEGLKVVDQQAFEGCTEVAIQTLPVSLTTVGEQAFEGCTGIDRLLVPKGFNATIGVNAFDGCTNLIEILNLSDLDIVAGAETYGKIGFYATTVGNSFDDVAMVQDKEYHEHTIEPKDDAASKLLRVLPILIVVGLLMGIIGMFYFGRKNTV